MTKQVRQSRTKGGIKIRSIDEVVALIYSQIRILWNTVIGFTCDKRNTKLKFPSDFINISFYSQELNRTNLDQRWVCYTIYLLPETILHVKAYLAKAVYHVMLKIYFIQLYVSYPLYVAMDIDSPIGELGR